MSVIQLRTGMLLAQRAVHGVHGLDVVLQALDVGLQIGDELQLAHAAALRALPVGHHPLVAAAAAAAPARIVLFIGGQLCLHDSAMLPVIYFQLDATTCEEGEVM